VEEGLQTSESKIEWRKTFKHLSPNKESLRKEKGAQKKKEE
jgi:hypothetical protein